MFSRDCSVLGIVRQLDVYEFSEELGLRVYIRFQDLMAASIKMAVFWVVASCSLVEVYVSEVLAASIIRAIAIF
jgi:hypothetical protein